MNNRAYASFPLSPNYLLYGEGEKYGITK